MASKKQPPTDSMIVCSVNDAMISNPDIIVKIEKIHPDAVIPQAKTKFAACFDLSASEPAIVRPGAVTIIKTGLKFEMPQNVEAEIRSRSGLASKGIFVLNSPGTIDSDYRGEIGVLLFNTSANKAFQVDAGDRIAQVAFRNVPETRLVEVEQITSDTERGDGGFGSTGLK